MLQLFLLRLPGNRVQPTNLLPTGVVITSNNHHRRLLPTEFASVLQPEAYSATERSLRSYPINPRSPKTLLRAHPFGFCAYFAPPMVLRGKGGAAFRKPL